MKKVSRVYAFEFSTKNYAEKKHDTKETNEVIIQPSFDFSRKTQEELHRLNRIDVESKQRMPQLRNKNNTDGSNEENE
jgi:hypothetical protein